jgi:Tetratricopeptide repeat
LRGYAKKRALSNYAIALTDLDRVSEGEEILRSLLPLMEKELGPAHNDVLMTRFNLARSWFLQHRYAESWQLLQEFLPSAREVFIEKHPDLQLFESLERVLRDKMPF